MSINKNYFFLRRSVFILARDRERLSSRPTILLLLHSWPARHQQIQPCAQLSVLCALHLYFYCCVFGDLAVRALSDLFFVPNNNCLLFLHHFCLLLKCSDCIKTFAPTAYLRGISHLPSSDYSNEATTTTTIAATAT